MDGNKTNENRLDVNFFRGVLRDFVMSIVAVIARVRLRFNRYDVWHNILG